MLKIIIIVINIYIPYIYIPYIYIIYNKLSIYYIFLIS